MERNGKEWKGMERNGMEANKEVSRRGEKYIRVLLVPHV
jgi:hypothetical protein